MPYYLYSIAPNGIPQVTDFQVDPVLFPEHTLVGTYQQKPEIDGKQFINGQLVAAGNDPEYVRNRRGAYPALGDQLDALWHAMDSGQLPKVEPMYSQVKAVKVRYPKPTN